MNNPSEFASAILQRLRKGELTPEQAASLFQGREHGRSPMGGSPLLFEPSWIPSGLVRKMGRVSDGGEAWLLPQVLAKGLESGTSGSFGTSPGSKVILGDRYVDGGDWLEVDPLQPEHFSGLVSIWSNRQALPRRILIVWPGGSDRLPDSTVSVFHAMVALAQSLLRSGSARPSQLVLAFSNRSGIESCACSALVGFFRSLRRENPLFDWKVVEIDQDTKLGDRSGILTRLQDEALYGDSDEVRLTENGRWVRSWKEMDPVAIPPVGWLREGGSYLVTGGLGGLGRELVKFLARRFRAKVMVCGRSPLDQERSLLLTSLASEGVGLEYRQADLNRLDDVDRLVSDAERWSGGLNGIFHLAGVVADSFLAKKTQLGMADVLGPKIQGCVHLDRATQNMRLDGFALFSSMASVWGNVGQCDYAFANGFLDAFSSWRESMRARGERYGRTISINWPFWSDGGMALGTGDVREMERVFGLRPLDKENGMLALERALSTGSPQVMVAAGDHERIRSVVLGGRWNPGSPVKVEPPAAARKLDPEIQPQSSISSREVEEVLMRIFSQRAKLPEGRLHRSDAWSKYGLDSVMVLDLTRELEEVFGPLPKTLFFEYTTVSELSEHLAKNFAGAMASRRREGREAISAVGRLSLPSKPSEEQNRFARKAPVDALASRKDSSGLESSEAGAQAIAVVGLAGRYPMAPDLDTFWKNLVIGRDCITEIPSSRWDFRQFLEKFPGDPTASYSRWGGFIDGVDLFDPQFFGISRREAEWMDPQERLFLQVAWAALEDAGHAPSEFCQTRLGVFVGVMWGPYQNLSVRINGRETSPMSSYASVANRVSYLLDATGPSLAVDTMCSSSLTALHLACDSIAKGESISALVGGVNLILHPEKYAQLCRQRFLSSDGRCRSFGAGGDGYVPGEGVGAVLLKPLAAAIEDRDHIYGVIRSSRINHGGKTSGFTVPNPNAQAAIIREALDQAGFDPSSIGYVEAHGTGTSLGDPIEIAGLRKAFSPQKERFNPCSIGSVKSNIGHLESAAGIAGLTKILLQIRHRRLVPSLHSEEPNPFIDFDDVPFRLQQELAEWKSQDSPGQGQDGLAPLRAALSSFGAGGSNAHVLVEEHPAEAGCEPSRQGPVLVVLSARNSGRLKESVSQIGAFLAFSGRVEDFVFGMSENDLENKAKGVLQGILDGLMEDAASVLRVEKTELSGDESLVMLGFDRLLARSFAQRVFDRLQGAVSVGWILEHDSIHSLANALLEREAIGGQGRISLHQGVIEKSERPALCDLAFTLQMGRDAMKERVAWVVSSLEELRERIEEYLRGDLGKAICGTAEASGGSEIPCEGLDLEHESGLRCFAEQWCRGGMADWSRLHLRQKPRRVSLPSYPFERVRCWVSDLADEAGPAPAEPETVSSDADNFFLPQWFERSFEAAKRREPSNVLIVYPESLASDAEILEGLHPNCATLRLALSLGRSGRSGDREVELDVLDPEVFKNLRQLDGPWDRVYFLDGGHLLGSSDSLVDEESLDMADRARALGVGALLGLVQGLAHRSQMRSGMEWIVATRGVYAVGPGDLVHPFGGLTSGFGLSLAREYPGMRFSLIDLPVVDQADAASVWKESVGGNVPQALEILAFRQGKWLGRDLVRVSTPEAPSADRPSSLRKEGVYLILGGAGGIGLATAQWLAQKANARIAIVGRRVLDAEMASRLECVALAGGQWEYFRADASDPRQMTDVVAKVRQRFGAIHGIIHSAISLADGTVETLTNRRLEQALAPKVQASILASVLPGLESLDFVLIFSSIQAFLGNAGQANYAAGSAFQDAWAACRDQRHRGGKGCTRVVDWGYWGEVGIVADEQNRRAMERVGILAIRTSEGVAALESILSAPCSALVYLKAETRFLERCGVYAHPPVALGVGEISDSLVHLCREGTIAWKRSARRFGGQLANDMLAFEELDFLGQAIVLRLFRDSGQSLLPGARLFPERLVVAKQHSQLAVACLGHLQSADILCQDDNAWYLKDSKRLEELLDCLDSIPQALSAFEKANPLLAPHARLLGHIGAELANVLSGKTKGIEVLFPEGSSERVAGIYKGTPITDEWSRLVAGLIGGFVREKIRNGAEKIRLLEIGAGTGGTTEFVLPALADFGGKVEYVFSDISSDFVNRARSKYSEKFPFVKFLVLDVQKMDAISVVSKSGGPLDLVVAANVLHAVRDVRSTLESVKSLLGPGGFLALSELAQSRLFYDLSFGLLDGWWAFEDPTRRLPNSPLLDGSRWRAVLAEAGFGSFALGQDEDGSNAWGQVALVAESDGSIPQAPRESRVVGQPAARLAKPERGFFRQEMVAAPAFERVVQILASVLRLDAASLDPDAPFAEMGVDSILALTLVEQVNQEFQSGLSAKDIFDHPTIRRLSSLLGTMASRDGRGIPSRTIPPRVGSDEGGKDIPDGSLLQVRLQDGSPLEIAIVGMSGKFAGSPNLEHFWRNLVDGRDLVSSAWSSRWTMAGQSPWSRSVPAPQHLGLQAGLLADAEMFDPLFFGISPKEAVMMDPQQRLFLQEAWKAIEDAGFSKKDLDASRCGVFVGARAGDYEKRLGPPGGEGDVFKLTGNDSSILAARISYFLNLKGPSMAVDTACSSSLTAIHLACQSLVRGDCEVAIAGGVCVLSTSLTPALFSKAGMLSPTGRCRTFSAEADGFVPAEGVGAILLKPLAKALQDGDHIHAVIRATGLNQDGATNGIMAPSAASQSSLLGEIYERYGINPETLDCIEAHGTGTKLGDPIEVSALRDAFAKYTKRTGFCALGSVKTNIGHALAAAGIAGVIKLVLSLKHGSIPPSLHCDTLNGAIDLSESPFYVNTKSKNWPSLGSRPRRGAVSAFGFSGTNAHIVLEEAPVQRRNQDPVTNKGRSHLVVFSGKTREALRHSLRGFRSWLDRERVEPDLADVSYTLLCGRSHFPHRAAAVVESIADLRSKLEHLIEGAPCESVWDSEVQTDLTETNGGPDRSTRKKGHVPGGSRLDRLAEEFVKGQV